MLEKIERKLKYYKKNFEDTVWFHTPKGIKNAKKLAGLKNKHAGKRCFIMGNGPSLLKCDISLLNDEITIASNAQFLIWDQYGFKPKYLTVEDRLVAEDRGAQLDEIEYVQKIFPKDLSYALSYTPSTLYINFLRNYPNFPQFSDDFVKQVYWGGTVTYLNLQLAYFMGCTEVYMIGFDHYYKVPAKMDNTVITSEVDDENHIHPDYFGKGYRWHDPNIERMEQSYEKAREFFEAHNVIIRNATVGGHLETFERIDFNTLF